MRLLPVTSKADDLLPSLYGDCHRIDEPGLVQALRERMASAEAISFYDAARCFIALYAWRNVVGYPAPTDRTGQATMRKLDEFATVFGFENDADSVRQIAATAEGEHWITADWGPSGERDAKEATYAYIDPGGLEAGAAIVSDIVAKRERKGELRIPAADRVVDLTHNSAAVSDADQKVAKAIDVIDGSNIIVPEVKSVWIQLLEEGRARLRKPSTYVAIVSALLLTPLYDAYASVIEESAKPIIKAALEAVTALIGF